MKLSISNICNHIIMICVLIYANYYAIINGLIGISSIYPIAVFCVIIMVFLFSGEKLKFQHSDFNIVCLWMLLVPFILVRNKDFANGNLTGLVISLLALSLLLLGGLNHLSKMSIPHMIIMIGIWNIIATFFFYIFPSTYTIMFSFYGEEVIGTGQGIFGYRAALADHYSQNGIFISIVVLVLGVMWMLSNKRKRTIFIFLILSFFALVLTAKRAHIIFCLAVIIALYYILNPQLIIKKSFKVVAAISTLCILVYYAYLYVPAVAILIERYMNVGEDGSFSERISMFKIAIESFKNHLIFGIGWGGFKYNYALVFGKTKNAHNTYMQLLCETGLVGFSIYMIAAITTLRCTLKTIRQINLLTSGDWKKEFVVTSLAIQLFTLIYQMTGNCLYDITAFFYFISVLMLLSARKSLQKETIKKQTVNSI